MTIPRKKTPRRRKTPTIGEQAAAVRATVARKIKHQRAADVGKVCPVCGCTEKDPCLVAGCPCGWVNYRGQVVCTACAPIEALLVAASGREWLTAAMEHAQANGFRISAGVLDDYQPCKSLAKSLRE